MPLEDLLSVEVSSVSRRLQRAWDSAAAIFVVTAEDIRDTGVTSVPEALRMVPGVSVARINANTWAVAARGFNGRFTNKLLVLIDGRTVYTPSFSGVYWDAQEIPLEDVERIEVIRGPGATLWGANAVNGVINIITRHTADTTGGQLLAGAGSAEPGLMSLRYGRRLADLGYGRAWLRGHRYGDLRDLASGRRAGDRWDSLRGGFRVDLTPNERDSLTLQGDVYDSDEHQRIASLVFPTPPFERNLDDRIDSSGWNLLGRWQRDLAGTGDLRIQAYYDHTQRSEVLLGQTHDTFDLDLQQHLSLGRRHELVWGLGYRRVRDAFDNSFAVSLRPPTFTTHLYSGFVQDEITLLPERLDLILGSKLEHNDFTGFEVQPNVRLIWHPTGDQVLWGAVSRAVRTPSRVDRNAVIKMGLTAVAPPGIPIFDTALGNPDFMSERLTAYELGWRWQPHNGLSLDLATYYNDYDRLSSLDFSTAPWVRITNRLAGHALGAELAGDWRPREGWRLHLAYTYARISLNSDDGIPDPLSMGTGEGSTPRQQLSLRSELALAPRWHLHLWGRYVGELPPSTPVETAQGGRVPPYWALDLRLAWQADDGLELSLSGHNLLHQHHLEFTQESFIAPTEVERAVFAQVRWRFE